MSRPRPGTTTTATTAGTSRQTGFFPAISPPILRAHGLARPASSASGRAADRISARSIARGDIAHTTVHLAISRAMTASGIAAGDDLAPFGVQDAGNIPRNNPGRRQY